MTFPQETHSSKISADTWAAEWGGKSIFSHGSKNSNGVMILINPKLDCKIGKCVVDTNDRYVITCFDLILTNVPAFMRESVTIETGLSDHCLVYTMLNMKLLQPRSESIFKRSLKNFDQTASLDDLSRVPFYAAYVFEDPDDDHGPIRKVNM